MRPDEQRSETKLPEINGLWHQRDVTPTPTRVAMDTSSRLQQPIRLLYSLPPTSRPHYLLPSVCPSGYTTLVT